MAEIFLNQKFIGNVDNAEDFLDNFKIERTKLIIDPSISIFYDKEKDEINVESSSGRALRPLIVVKDGKPLLTEKQIDQLARNDISWTDLVKQGIIEYLDAAEEENAYVGFVEDELTPEHTHLEVFPGSMFGIVASQVPYANHCLGPRVLIAAKNQKQSIGLYASNYNLRLDVDTSILHYPQVPIVRTIGNMVVDYEKHPAGQNVVIAVMTWKGYNIEDALVLNQSSIEFGFARSTYFRTVEAEELKFSGGLVEKVAVPDKDVVGFRSEHDYRFLEDDGIAYPEANLSEGDIVVGKISPPRFLSGMDEYSITTVERRESSIEVAHGEHGIVDTVVLTESEDGNKLVRVKLRSNKNAELGDKFIARHAQKGVVGLLVSRTDMPFTQSGITPDVILNPHGMPTRMTVSYLLEALAGKVGSLDGRFVNGTTFESEPEESLRKHLKELGFTEDGTEIMYNGITGEKYEARIFVGNMYYLKLKHMVSNVLHARERGPVQLLTMQPTEGRAREGGLRLGEMENDIFVSQGASLLLKERFSSDKTNVPICQNCGMVAIYNAYKNKSSCSVCGEGTDISHVQISYAFKLFLDELKSLGVYPKIKLKSRY